MSYVVMLDTIGGNVPSIPVSTEKVAGYVTGTNGSDGSVDIIWDSADWSRFPTAGKVRIDQSPTLSEWDGADVFDVETGAATIATAVSRAKEREAKGWYTFIYISQGAYSTLTEAVKAAGLKKVQYWVANWNLSEDEAAAQLGGDIVAIQFASPSSNPDTITPGGTEPLKKTNVDISVTIPAWFQPAVPSKPLVNGLVVAADLSTVEVHSTDRVTWTKR
jgi:hypothetical protein